MKVNQPHAEDSQQRNQQAQAQGTSGTVNQCHDDLGEPGVIDPMLASAGEGEGVGQHGPTRLQGLFAGAQMPPQIAFQRCAGSHEKDQDEGQD